MATLYEEEQSFLDDGPYVSAVKKAFRPISTRYQKAIDLATPHIQYRWYFSALVSLVTPHKTHSRSARADRTF